MADRTCRVCGALSPEQAQFCMACGTAFAARCVRCGTENPPEASFCVGCGAALAEQRAGGHAATGEAIPGADSTGRAAKGETGGVPPIPPETLPEERRQAAVLFADISGYTAIAKRMDPESSASPPRSGRAQPLCSRFTTI